MVYPFILVVERTDHYRECLGHTGPISSVLRCRSWAKLRSLQPGTRGLCEALWYGQRRIESVLRLQGKRLPQGLAEAEGLQLVLPVMFQ